MATGMAYMFSACVTSISAVIMVVSARWQLVTVALLHEVDNADLSQAAAYGVIIIVVVWGAILIMGCYGTLAARKVAACPLNWYYKS